MASGKANPKYKALLSHSDTLADTLDTNERAKTRLLRKLRANQWIDDLTTDALVALALQKLETEGERVFDQFVGFMSDIAGLTDLAIYKDERYSTHHQPNTLTHLTHHQPNTLSQFTCNQPYQLTHHQPSVLTYFTLHHQPNMLADTPNPPPPAQYADTPRPPPRPQHTDTLHTPPAQHAADHLGLSVENYQILFLVCHSLWTVAVGGGGGYERVVQCRVVGSLQNCVLVSLTQLWGRQDVRAFTTVKPKSFT